MLLADLGGDGVLPGYRFGGQVAIDVHHVLEVGCLLGFLELLL